ncbi:MAG: hypothetical protein Q8L89_05165 [Gammaproteobacteria bacterium]|nr:hypothetical protein [Gammaproteobacteria bacterium]
MNKYVKARALTVVMAVLFTAPSFAADDPALLKDMTSVIALLGLSCGQVVSATQQGDNDHIVSCTDGNRYRVFVNAEGRVVAEKQ